MSALGISTGILVTNSIVLVAEVHDAASWQAAMREWILVEAMAQSAGASIVARGLVDLAITETASFILVAVKNVRFRRPVRPGDTLVTVAQNLRLRNPLAVFAVRGYVKGTLVAEATVKCMIGER